MGKILLWTIGLYLLYKFIFNFILPVYTNARRIRKQFNDVRENMQSQQQAYAQAQQRAQEQSAQSSNTSSHSSKKTAIGEYIDFEEVK